MRNISARLLPAALQNAWQSARAVHSLRHCASTYHGRAYRAFLRGWPLRGGPVVHHCKADGVRQHCGSAAAAWTMSETTENPISSAAAVQGASQQYEGQFGAARGPGSVSVVVNPGGGLITDMVTIVDDTGDKKVRMPDQQLPPPNE